MMFQCTRESSRPTGKRYFRGWRPDRCDRVALVLHVGRALGANQAGVCQAMPEARIEPDWVSGLHSAINAAITAGNPPKRRLRQLETFWEMMTSRKIWAFTPDGAVFSESAKCDELAHHHGERPTRLLRAAISKPLVQFAGRQDGNQLLRHVTPQGNAARPRRLLAD
jgi:predicted acylesterase/phospholipase RssA